LAPPCGRARCPNRRDGGRDTLGLGIAFRAASSGLAGSQSEIEGARDCSR